MPGFSTNPITDEFRSSYELGGDSFVSVMELPKDRYGNDSRRVKNLMRLRGSRISTGLPAAGGSGFGQSI